MPRKTRGRDRLPTNIERFNEAAARCRGKLARFPESRRVLLDASMRPRPDAAENLMCPLALTPSPPPLQ